MITIDQALTDPNLLGANLGDASTFATWLAILKAAHGLPLTEDEAARFQSVAHRPPPTHRVSEFFAVAGRQSGKSLMAGALCAFTASVPDWSAVLDKGAQGYVLCLAETTQQAKRVWQYAYEFLNKSPVLRSKIDNVTTTEIRLKNGVTIAVEPSNHRTIRGKTLLLAVCDELAFFKDESSANADVEVYRALLPALVNAKGMLVCISSPYRRTGLLYTKHRDFFGKDDPNVLVVQAATRELNPTFSEEAVERMMRDDPEANIAELQAEFRSDLSDLFPDDVVDDAVMHDRKGSDLPPLERFKYYAFADASAGGSESFTFAIGHTEGSGDDAVVYVDVLRGARAEDPYTLVAVFAELCKTYRINKVRGDKFAKSWVEQGFAKHGIKYEFTDKNKSDIVLESLPMWLRGSVKIPRHETLIRELKQLQRIAGRGGRDRVDHPRRGTDDYANVCCGLVCYAPTAITYADRLDKALGGPEARAAREAREQERRAEFMARNPTYQLLAKLNFGKETENGH